MHHLLSLWPSSTFHVRCLSLLAGLAAALLSSCARQGGKSSDTPIPALPQDTSVADPYLALRTQVKFHAMGYKTLQLGFCQKQGRAETLPTLAENFKLDGNFVEWDGAVSLRNSLGSGAEFSLSRVMAARSGNDLILAISAGAGTLPYIELSGFVVRQNTLMTSVQKRFRLVEGQLQQEFGGSWQSITSEDGQGTLGENGYEIRISSRWLGDSLAWPVWGLRVSSESSVSPGLLNDSTPAHFFISQINPEQTAFSIDGCLEWSSRVSPFVFQHIQDTIPLASGPAYPLAKLSDAAFALARMAFDAVAALTPGEAPLPVERLAVVATASKVMPQSPLADDFLASRYRGIFLNVTSLAPNSLDPYPEGKVFREIVGHLLDLWLHHRFAAAPSYLSGVMREALADHMVIQQLGLSYWLDNFYPELTPLRSLTSHEGVALSLASQFEALQAASRGQTLAADAVSLYQARIKGYGHLLSGYFTKEELLRAWLTTKSLVENGAEPSQAFFEGLSAQKGDAAHQPLLAGLSAGWLFDQPYHPDYGPMAFEDWDYDGLPNYLERIRGTDPKNQDSDNDSWSDLAEILAEEDPLQNSRKPLVIMPDGSFNDWLELLPKRVHVAKGNASTCPRAADISHYAALVDRDVLMIGAVAQDFWDNEPKAQWEAVIDFPKDNHKVLVTAAGDSREFFVKDPKTLKVLRHFQRAMPMGRKTIEWAFDKKVLNYDKALDGRDAVKIQIRTIYNDGESRLCAETAWFAPYITTF